MDGNHFDTITKLFAERRVSRRNALRHGGAGLAAGALTAAGLTATASAQPASPAMAAAYPNFPPVAATLSGSDPGTFAVLEIPAPGATAIATPAVESAKPTMFLFLQSFETGSLMPVAGTPGHYTLTLRQGLGETVYFSDRPQKIVGTMPTPSFLEGLGFTPDNPPNAALVGHRSPTQKDVVVLELRNPRYDKSSNTATYDVTLLQDWQKLDEKFGQTPDDSKHLPRDFTAAHLFIDDCADSTYGCIRNGQNASKNAPTKSVGLVGFCWDWGAVTCKPCQDPATVCNQTLPDFCQGDCRKVECNQFGCF